MSEEVASSPASTSVDNSEMQQLEDVKGNDTNTNEEPAIVNKIQTEILEEIEQLQNIQDEVRELMATEKLVTQTPVITLASNTQPIFAPLNTPLYRRRQTMTILIWFLVPWFCLVLSFFLLRSQNWYVVGAFVAYLTWMTFFQKFPREGGIKQDWFRRLQFWKWGAGKYTSYICFCRSRKKELSFQIISQFIYIKHVNYHRIVRIFSVIILMV